VITAPDDDPDAEPVPCQVEEIFENYLPLLDLYVNGRTIRTTAEHPFWVRDRGWVAAHQLEAGDELRALDGRWLKVDGLEGPKASETVYNMCVADYHTYFIGHQIWGFAVWSHNAGVCGNSSGRAPKSGPRTTKVQAVEGAGPHTGFKRDPQTGEITGHTTFDENGFIAQRTDITGAAHGGVPTPHTHIHGPPNVAPDGRLFPGGEITVRPALPSEIPKPKGP
jgi:hypothetical protein